MAREFRNSLSNEGTAPKIRTVVAVKGLGDALEAVKGQEPRVQLTAWYEVPPGQIQACANKFSYRPVYETLANHN